MTRQIGRPSPRNGKSPAQRDYDEYNPFVMLIMIMEEDENGEWCLGVL